MSIISVNAKELGQELAAGCSTQLRHSLSGEKHR